MDYRFAEDLKIIREILGITQSELADRVNVQQITLSRNENGVTKPSKELIERIYSFAFDNNINLGKLKEMLWFEKMKRGQHKLLFHGSKSTITGNIDITKGRANNDFGQGFYTGESYEQAVSFVSGFDYSSIYFLDFNSEKLRYKQYSVDQKWILTIAYYRGTLDKYESHPLIKKLINEANDCDYIIAPIADNRMFQIINSFINGEITDEQCKHCLAATNLGSQYVFKTKKAVDKIKILEKTYISLSERKHFKDIKIQDNKLGEDKVKIARRQFRDKGLYIDDILK